MGYTRKDEEDVYFVEPIEEDTSTLWSRNPKLRMGGGGGWGEKSSQTEGRTHKNLLNTFL